MDSLLALKAPAAAAENTPPQPVSPARQVLVDAQRFFTANPEQATASSNRELDSLSKEKDEELLAAGLVHFAGQLKGKKKLEGAAFIYSRLAESEVPAEQRQKAAAELGAMTGAGGSFGQRAEFLFSRFQEDSTSYQLIAPMLGATFLGQVAGSAALGRLLAPAARGSGGLLGSAWMARAGAASTGYLAEVSAFTVLGRALAPQTPGPWTDDFARGALTVGVFKFAGTAGQGLGKHMASTPYAPLNRISQTVLPQATALTGLMAAHRLEEKVGLRPHVEGQNLFFESLASLAALTVGARLGRGVLGEGFHQTQAELQLRSRQLSNTPRWPELFRPKPALALAGGLPGSFAPAEPPLGQVWAMAMNGNGNGGGGKKTGTFGSDRLSDGGVPARVRQSGYSKEPRPETLDPADVVEHYSLPPESNSTPAGSTVEVRDAYVGTVIGGRYRIDAMLAEGGMGMVYRGEMPAIERPVAIKLLKKESVENPEVVHRFLTEAKIVQKIDNPHIIDVLDFGQLDNGAYYLVMEFLKGKELSSLIDVDLGKTEPLERFLPIFRQIAEGLQAAHEAGVVHRDLKPENIYLVKRGNEKDFVKILDFGIAKVQTAAGNARLTQEGVAFGTPMYMSPEQVKGDPIDHRSDIYSFGAVLYEAVTAKMLWHHAKTIPEIYTLHLNNAPIPPRQMAANPEKIPEGLEAIILKCLQKEPDHRYQSMDEVIADIDLLQRNMAPQALNDIVVRKATSSPFANAAPFPGGANGQVLPTGSRHDPTMYIPRKKPFPKLAIGGSVVAAGALGAATYFLLSNGKDDSKTKGAAPSPEVTPPPVPTPEVAPIKPDATPAPEKIPVLLSVEPSDAKIFQDDKDLGKSPVLLQLEKGSKVELVVRREGYKIQAVTIDGSQDKVAVNLEKEGRANPRPSGNPRPKASNGPKTPKPKGSSEEIYIPWK
ncbi:MAG TPA: serine/threonine-protein kinase [bacterium]|nr:serine/threonine-protein kinase [bacterium]